MSRRSCLLMLAALITFAAFSAWSAPLIINYQGSLSDAVGAPLDGKYSMTFRIYSTLIGVPPLWSEYHDSVVVDNGRFSVALGSFTAMDDAIYNGDNRYLEIQVGASVLSPRTRLSSAPYSFRVESVNGATGGTIDGGVAVRTGLVKTPEDAIKVTDPTGGSVVKVSVDYSSSSTAMSFYDPIDSKSGLASFESDEHIDYSGVSQAPGPEIVRIGTDGVIVFDTLGDTVFYASSKKSLTSRHDHTGQIGTHITGDYDGPSGAILKVEYTGPNTSDYDAVAIKGVCNQNLASEFGRGGVFEGGAIGVSCSGYSIGCMGVGMDDNGQTIGTYGGTYPTNFGNAYGLYGAAQVSGDASGYGVYGWVTGATTGSKYAGYFSGNVFVSGSLAKAAGSFKIDHPLDPANKYLSHSFVESPDMMNVYNGNVTTDAGGFATVQLPDYFEALNRDFRYQLTVIGQFAQAIVSQEIAGNSFVIQTDKPNVKVSWQVTGIRQDAYANAHRIPTEEVKPSAERGKYIHPELFGGGEEQGIDAALTREVVQDLPTSPSRDRR